MSLIQREIDDMIMVINNANSKLREQQAINESHEQVITLQQEMITLLKEQLEAKTKYIEILERQLVVIDKHMLKG